MSVLALGSFADPTYRYTVQRMQAHELAIAHFDYAGLLRHFACTLDFDDPLGSVIQLSSEGPIRFSEFDAIFVRAVPSKYSDPAHEETYHAAECALGEFLSFSGLRVMNPPIAAPHNNAKILHQTAIASVSGFMAPESIVTTVQSHAIDFFKRHNGRVIIKGVSGLKTWARFIASVDELRSIGSTPVLLQQWIAGPEVRVHVVGQEAVFAEEISSEAVDYRLAAFDARAVELPDAIAEGCRRIARWLGIPLVGIDLRMNNGHGPVVALEANPCPGYDGYDRRASGAISDAMLAWLTRTPIGSFAR